MKVRVSLYAGFRAGKVRKYQSSKESSEDRATLFSVYCWGYFEFLCKIHQ